jgi:hypothetical protein
MQLLVRFPKLFRGKLGCFPNKKVHLELRAGAKPFCCQPYPIPRHHEQVFKEELQHLCDIGVLERSGPYEWLLPLFIIDKSDGFPTFQSLTSLLSEKYIIFQRYKISCYDVPGTCSLPS